MRKIILIVIATLLLTNIGFAEMRMIEQKVINTKGGKLFYSTFCVDGYKFVKIGQGAVQFYEQKSGWKTHKPAKC